MNKSIIKNVPYDCTKCGKVTFSVKYTQFENYKEVYAQSFDKIVGCVGNRCEVYNETDGHPTYIQMEKDCPFYQDKIWKMHEFQP
jgi:hypothetical protein